MFDFISKTLIEKGWSCDKKYCAVTEDGTKYLLRITPTEKSSTRHEMFRMQQQVAELGVPICEPLEFGTCDEGIYMIQTWIDGNDAEDFIINLSDEDTYNYGVKSGEILKVIHSIPAPLEQENWESRFNKRIDMKLKMYAECPIKYDNIDSILDYIENNRHLLKDRPQVFQHGDYHIGNMMITKSGELRIIDFDRYDFGDPWEEFNRIVWCAQKAPFFATGMVNGYFNSDVPMDFWRLLALYVSSNTLGSLPWAVPFGKGEIDTMKNQCKEILSWYDNMQNVVPTWYKVVK